MICPSCGTETPPPLDRCYRCSTPFPEVTAHPADSSRTDSETIGISNQPTGISTPTVGTIASGTIGLASDGTLAIGEMFGRYRIIRLIGSGGMGQVYQAWDQAIEEAVALKVIRPEFASNPDADARFKRELSVARQVTHRNVVRIHDLGQVGNVKFISMSFIAGIDLATMMAGTLPRDLALSIVHQICEGLAAAHRVGVAHRDLKPQNIMVDRAGQAYLMDFGLARSVDASQYTMSGAVLGTVEYMSPEQALGKPADHRSDIYSLGIILYELFTGKGPFKGETPMSRLSERLHTPAPDPRDTQPDVPAYLAQVMLRCLERDPAERYQDVDEILADFDAQQAATRPWQPILRRYGARAAMAAAAVVILLAGGYVARRPARAPAAPAAPASGPTLSLAILPFHNASGDPTLDWLGQSLAEMLRTGVGQSSYLRTLSSPRISQVLRDLRFPPDAVFDDGMLTSLSDVTGAQTFVRGQYVRSGDHVRIDATISDAKTGRSPSGVSVEANEKDLLKSVDELAQKIQQTLVSSPDVIKELRARAFRPSSASVLAVRYYNEGLQLMRQGNDLEAKKRFDSSIAEDPAFALAEAGLGLAYSNLGYDNDAEHASSKAVDLAAALPPQEKYLVRAIHARVTHDTQTAIESYENLVKVLPDDTDVESTLADLYENTGALDKARDAYARVLQRDPKQVDALLAMGRIEIKRSKPQDALDYLNSAQTLAIRLQNDMEKATIQQAIGVAYKRLDNLDEALRNYEQSLEIKRRIGDKRGMASSLSEIAQVEDRLGKSDAALKSYNEALQVRRDIGDKRGIGSTLIDLGSFHNTRGEYDEALTLLKEARTIQRDVGNTANEALCLNNIGTAYLAKGQSEDALTNFTFALQIREKGGAPADIAETLYNLGEVSTNLGQYPEALKYRARAIELWRQVGNKHGVALASHGMGTMFANQGRYDAALGAEGEAVKNLRDLKDQYWLAEVLGGYANVLGQIGKVDEARKNLDEALAIARSIKNQNLVARLLGYQGDTFYYVGDFKPARSLYEQALDAAGHSTDRSLMLTSKMNLAKIAIKEKRPDAAAALKRYSADADQAGMKYLSLECALLAAEGLLNAKQPSPARMEIERVLVTSDRLGLRELFARAQYLLAGALRADGKRAEADRSLAEARRALDEVVKESHGAELTRRVDLSPILASRPQ